MVLINLLKKLNDNQRAAKRDKLYINSFPFGYFSLNRKIRPSEKPGKSYKCIKRHNNKKKTS